MTAAGLGGQESPNAPVLTSQPKKGMSWASVASQPAKVQPSRRREKTILTNRHMDIGTWDGKNGSGPKPVAPPPAPRPAWEPPRTSARTSTTYTSVPPAQSPQTQQQQQPQQQQLSPHHQATMQQIQQQQQQQQQQQPKKSPHMQPQLSPQQSNSSNPPHPQGHPPPQHSPQQHSPQGLCSQQQTMQQPQISPQGNNSATLHPNVNHQTIEPSGGRPLGSPGGGVGSMGPPQGGSSTVVPPSISPSGALEDRTDQPESQSPILEDLQQRNRYNPAELDLDTDSARFFVIKSYSEDDVHRSIKYEIWCSTEHGNKRLDQAFREQSENNWPIYLLFSVNGTGHFCGVAQMLSNVDYSSSASVWAQDKWKGQFKVKWIYVKDVPNNQLRHIRLENNENKPVTKSRDTQEVPFEKGKQVSKSFLHFYY